MTKTTTTSWAMAAQLAAEADATAEADRWAAEAERNAARLERGLARLSITGCPVLHVGQGQVRAELPEQTEVEADGWHHQVAVHTVQGSSRLQLQVRGQQSDGAVTAWLPAGELGTLADLGRALTCDLGELLEANRRREPSTAELLHQVLQALVRDVVADVLGQA